ncbi:hypothetical protein EFU33_10100 [Vibrio cholerae]|nr:hypothetical protein [Vibrio cholerae]
MKLQRCWLRSFTPITSFIYAHGDSLTCRLPVTPSCLGINLTGTVSFIGLLHIHFVNNVICISFPNRKLTIYFFSLTKIQPCT